jgi:hypothetical protein
MCCNQKNKGSLALGRVQILRIVEQAASRNGCDANKTRQAQNDNKCDSAILVWVLVKLLRDIGKERPTRSRRDNHGDRQNACNSNNQFCLYHSACCQHIQLGALLVNQINNFIQAPSMIGNKRPVG